MLHANPHIGMGNNCSNIHPYVCFPLQEIIALCCIIYIPYLQFISLRSRFSIDILDIVQTSIATPSISGVGASSSCIPPPPTFFLRRKYCKNRCVTGFICIQDHFLNGVKKCIKEDPGWRWTWPCMWEETDCMWAWDWYISHSSYRNT